MENNKKKADNSLLNLEKKLGNVSTDEIILNKFKLKPNFDLGELKKTKNYMSDLNSFLTNFKNSTEELVNNPEMIEAKKIEDSGDQNETSKDKKFIKLNLALGVLDIKEKNLSENNENDLMNNIISFKSVNTDPSTHPLLNSQADKEILKFLMKNSNKRNKRRKRLHKIKNKK